MLNVKTRRDYWRSYYKRNADKLRAKQNAWKRAHRDRVNASRRRHYKENREKVRRWQNQWRVSTGRIAFDNNRRRERRCAAGECDPVSANVLTQLIQSLPKMKCALCNRNMKQGDRTIDHVIPLSKGGSGHIGNLQVVHRGCNSQKHARLPDAIDGQLQIHLAGRVAA